jgi:Ca2+-binding EF-hand superfamily protein
LSKAQTDQIREIFQLFDTDGTGCIEHQEIKFAMSALGFQTTTGKGKTSDEVAMLQVILGDGKVTLDEFSALMTGEIGGYKPYEEARTVFALLSRSDGDETRDGLITLNKLEAVCMEYQVFLLQLMEFRCHVQPAFTLLMFHGISSAVILTICFHYQMPLSSEDLKMMVAEVSGRRGSGFNVRGAPLGPGIVNLQTFIEIMGNSSW